MFPFFYHGSVFDGTISGICFSTDTELIVYNESGNLIYDSCQHCTVEEIENAEGAEELEEKLNAYIQSTNLESYHIICYLKKAKASEIPFSIMIINDIDFMCENNSIFFANSIVTPYI